MNPDTVRWFIAAGLVLGLCGIAAVVTEMRARRRVTVRAATPAEVVSYLTCIPSQSAGSDE